MVARRALSSYIKLHYTTKLNLLQGNQWAAPLRTRGFKPLRQKITRHSHKQPYLFALSFWVIVMISNVLNDIKCMTIIDNLHHFSYTMWLNNYNWPLVSLQGINLWTSKLRYWMKVGNYISDHVNKLMIVSINRSTSWLFCCSVLHKESLCWIGISYYQ